MGEAGYSFSLTTFSPSGKLLQIEHALKAVQAGKTSLGIQGMCSGYSIIWLSEFAISRAREVVFSACIASIWTVEICRSKRNTNLLQLQMVL